MNANEAKDVFDLMRAHGRCLRAIFDDEKTVQDLKEALALVEQLEADFLTKHCDIPHPQLSH